MEVRCSPVLAVPVVDIVALLALEGVQLHLQPKGHRMEFYVDGKKALEVGHILVEELTFCDQVTVNKRYPFKVIKLNQQTKVILRDVCHAMGVQIALDSESSRLDRWKALEIVKMLRDIELLFPNETFKLLRAMNSCLVECKCSEGQVEQIVSETCNHFHDGDGFVPCILLYDLVRKHRNTNILFDRLLTEMVCLAFKAHMEFDSLKWKKLQEEVLQTLALDLANPTQMIKRMEQLHVDWTAPCLLRHDREQFDCVGMKLLHCVFAPNLIYSCDARRLFHSASHAFPFLAFRAAEASSRGFSQHRVRVLGPTVPAAGRNDPWLHLAWTPPDHHPTTHLRSRRRMYARGFAYCPSKGL
eukprot:287149-Hanusia_phi.AAC.1